MHDEAQLVASGLFKIDAGVGRHRECGADKLRGNRQFATAAVDEGGQPYAGGAPVVKQFVHRGADGAPRIQDVVDQHEFAAVDLERDGRGRNLALEALAVKVIAVKRNVQRAHRQGEAEFLVQTLGQPGAAGDDTDQGGLRRHMRAHLCRQRFEQCFGVR